MVPLLRSFGVLWWGVLACPPHFLWLHPCLHSLPDPARWSQPPPCSHPDTTHFICPHPTPKGLARGCCPMRDCEDWLGSDGWGLSENSHVSLSLPQSPPRSLYLVTAGLALADCPVPGLDLKSPEGSSQPCVWPPPCPIAWLWVWQAGAGQPWGGPGRCVGSRVRVCVREIWVVQRTPRGGSWRASGDGWDRGGRGRGC